jgi:Flp pilus assembly protein TadD
MSRVTSLRGRFFPSAAVRADSLHGTTTLRRVRRESAKNSVQNGQVTALERSSP